MSNRIPVLKTYKIFINGQFPRTESGRYYKVKDAKGKFIANACLCSRKDVRDAVKAAYEAIGKWNKASAFLKSQIVYRMAEVLEGRKSQFIDELTLYYGDASKAKEEVESSIDRLVYFSGWADKYQQVFSSVNPIAGSYFNFSVYEPTGVIGIFCPDEFPLLGLISAIIPAIVAGNCVVALASEKYPLPSITFAEALATSDLPSGVVNILTGSRKELIDHLSTHLQVHGLVYFGNNQDEIKTLQNNASINVKRVNIYPVDMSENVVENPYRILDVCEVKTTWHPIENIQPSGGGY
jgi:acyl-CoA reductase-like NAD-dependent aldehyde dehydrogenase